jgi:hypothetical protein
MQSPEGNTKETVQHEVSQAADHARSATQDVAQTARDQARQVTQEARDQGRRVVTDTRERLAGEIDSQAGRAAQGLRRLADELDRMAESATDGSAARTAVRQLSDTGRRAAGYLEEHGAGGVVEEVGEFARRRPGTFLIAAAATGFLAGRLGKAVARAGSSTPEEDSGDVTGDVGSGVIGDATGPTVPPATPATPPSTGAYGTSPYETGAQASPPGFPGEVR